MRSPILDYLDRIIDETADVTGGALADYIPELAAADPDHVAVALCTVNGTVYASGDAERMFSIQSMSKPFAYALAIEDRGLDAVGQKVGVEPSGEAFNDLSLDDENRPRNPMINAGAIMTHTLIDQSGASAEDRLIDLFSRLAERRVSVNESIAASELATADRNLGLAYLLHAAHTLELDPQEAVAGYTRQCSIEVSVQDLALMAATLANGGVQPNTRERILDRDTTRQVLSVMATCGMYDAAGDWFSTVGIPAKSGVAGGIIGVLPGQVGVAVFSPRLDEHGNSERGIAMMRHLSRDLGLHLMDATRPGRSALREVQHAKVDGEEATIYVLQGDLILSSIEALTHELVEHEPDTDLVVFDMSRVDEVRPVARRTSEEMAKKLADGGYRVVRVDPDGTAAKLIDANGRSIEEWDVERFRARMSPSRRGDEGR